MEVIMEVGKKNKIITIENYEKISLNGVNHIVGFDEKCIILSTDLGNIIIDGKEMKIESLSKDNGEVYIIGKFQGLYFAEEKKKKRLFKSSEI